MYENKNIKCINMELTNIKDVKIEDLGQYLGLRRQLQNFTDEEILAEYEIKKGIHREKFNERNSIMLERYYKDAEELFELGYYKGTVIRVDNIFIGNKDNIKMKMDIGTFTDLTLTGDVLGWKENIGGVYYLTPWFKSIDDTGSGRYLHKNSLGCPQVIKSSESKKTFIENVEASRHMKLSTSNAIFLV